jgi:hypothetical protein
LGQVGVGAVEWGGLFWVGVGVVWVGGAVCEAAGEIEWVLG